METDAAYIFHLEQRVAQLETRANTLKHNQEIASRQRATEHTGFMEEVHLMLQEVERTEQELSDLAQKIKTLILLFQYTGMQTQLTTLRERADMLALDQWVTRKEIKKLLAK